MRRLLRSLLSLSILAATGVLLVADSAPVCTHGSTSAEFDVTGTCGPPGRIRVTSGEDACGIEVERAAAVGLPSEASFGDPDRPGSSYELSAGQFSFSGVVQAPRAASDGGEGAGGGAGSDIADAGSATEFTSCRSNPSNDGLVCDNGYTCEYTLTPVTR